MVREPRVDVRDRAHRAGVGPTRLDVVSEPELSPRDWYAAHGVLDLDALLELCREQDRRVNVP